MSMVRSLVFATALACLLQVRPAFAQGVPGEDISAGPAVQAQAQRNVDQAEAAYAASANGTDPGGIAGVVATAADGSGPGKAQILRARADARQKLTDALTQENNVYEERRSHLLASGDTVDANTLLAQEATIQSRLGDLAFDASNDDAAKNGAPLQPLTLPHKPGAVAGGGGGGGYSGGGGGAANQGTPNPAPADAAAAAEAAMGGQVATGTDGKPIAAEARKATGKVAIVAKSDKAETTLKRLDAECERLRKGVLGGDEGLDAPAEVEIWIVEKWKDKKPVRIHLQATPDNAKELAALRAHLGSTVTVEGKAVSVVLSKEAAANGDVFELREWKVVEKPADGSPATDTGDHEPKTPRFQIQGGLGEDD